MHRLWRVLAGACGLCAACGFGPSVAAAPTQLTLPAIHFNAADAASRSVAVTDEAGARQTPFAGFSVRQVPGREWTIVTFYVMFREVTDGDARRRESYWVARRMTGDDTPRSHAPPAIEWASSGKCTDLDGIVRTMGEEIGDRIDIAVPGEGDPSESRAGSLLYDLWSGEARFRGTGYAAVLRLTADSGSPLALWIDGSASALASCWAGGDPPDAVSAAP